MTTANDIPTVTDDATLLRLITCGSVDDGKSTVIGRLLYDTDSIYDDQLAAIERSSRTKGHERTDLALLTDGLRAEREQGITIDVAYRYFSTQKRTFILADAPGHEQYTRNMATAASSAQVAVVLADARTGVITQTRRHATIASIMGVRHFVLCVNKMDLVDWDEKRFDEIAGEFSTVVRPGEPSTLQAIPMCAVEGDNVVRGSQNLAWYRGPTLLEHLESLDVTPPETQVGGRLSVQWVIRPQTAEASLADYRGYAGRISAGTFRVGDEVLALPTNQSSTITALQVAGHDRTSAGVGDSVTIQLADDIDISRGDLICSAEEPALVRRDVEARIVWMSDKPLRKGSKYLVRHATRKSRGMVTGVIDRLDLNQDETREQDVLGLNDVGRITLRTAGPLAFDRYQDCRGTGAFILIDEATKDTVGAAGTILGPDPSIESSGYVI